MKYYQQFSNNKKSNRRKWITIFNLNGLVLILLNDNLTFTKNILFNIIEAMKKTNGNISINENRKNILLKFIF